MGNRLDDKWTLSVDQQQTIGFIVGLCILVWWAVDGFNPNAAMSGIVSALLVGQRLIHTAKEVRDERKGNGEEGPRVAERTNASDTRHGDRHLDRRRGDLLRWCVWTQ